MLSANEPDAIPGRIENRKRPDQSFNMTIKTYRARSIHDALDMVRQELGPDASVLHTREVRSGLLGWLGAKEVEVAASATIRL